MQTNRKSFGTLKSDRYIQVTVIDEWPLWQVLRYYGHIQCRIMVARGPWHILSAGPLRRGLATFATSTGARRETMGGQKDKLSRGERGYRMAVLTK